MNPFAGMGNLNDPNAMADMMQSPAFLDQMGSMLQNPEVVDQVSERREASITGRSHSQPDPGRSSLPTPSSRAWALRSGRCFSLSSSGPSCGLSFRCFFARTSADSLDRLYFSSNPNAMRQMMQMQQSGWLVDHAVKQVWSKC